MNLRQSLWVLGLGLGAVAGAVLPPVLAAQVPVRRDTVSGRRDTLTVRLPPRADTLIKGDSTTKSVVPLPAPKADTIQPPLARGEAPPVLEIGPPRIYDRAALFATGALTMSDLLSRVPGVTEFAAGFLAAPTVLASQGDLRRIRLFLDGLELDPMDRRARGVAPTNDLPLNTLEEVRIERGAEEVRVYARSWRVERTVPFTRTDVGTGDQNTNLFRGYFGRRYDHGEALQVAADYYNTQPDRSLPSSDALSYMARVGITRGPWSADAFTQSTHKNRAQWIGTGEQTDQAQPIPGIETRRSTAYLRLGNGDPDRGRWLQLLASAQGYVVSARTSTSLSSTLPSARDSATANADSVAYESQYLITGGVTRGPVQLSGAERVRIGGHRTSHVMSGRASAVSGPIALSLFTEGQSYLNPSRTEGTARLSVLDRLAIVASASRTAAGDFDRLFDEPRSGAVFDEPAMYGSKLGPVATTDSAEVTRYRLAGRNNLRAEAGIRVRDLWLTAGVMRRGATTLLAPAEFDKSFARVAAVRSEGEATARTISARGRIFKAIHADAWAVAWNDSVGLYRPRYQTRSELYIQTSLLDKFPRGNFGLLTSLAHEYRSSSHFPIGVDSVRTAPGYRVLTFRLEIRVQTAVVSYQFRNVLQEKYAQVPGFNMPRQTQFYGIRWDFWN